MTTDQIFFFNHDMHSSELVLVSQAPLNVSMKLCMLGIFMAVSMVEGRVVLPHGGTSCPGLLSCIPVTSCPAVQGVSKLHRLQIIK